MASVKRGKEGIVRGKWLTAAKAFSRARDISCVDTHRVVIASSAGLSVLATAPDSIHDIAMPA